MSTHLYHGTSVNAALEILRTNRVGSGSDDNYHEGVSLTRSLELAWDFAELNEALIGSDTKGAVLVFDRDKLDETFQLTEVEFFDDDRDEEEERTDGDIEPANQFVVEIIVEKIGLADDVLDKLRAFGVPVKLKDVP